LYLIRRSLEVLRKFHWMILGGQFNQLSHVSFPFLSKPGEYIANIAIIKLGGDSRGGGNVLSMVLNSLQGKRVVRHLGLAELAPKVILHPVTQKCDEAQKQDEDGLNNENAEQESFSDDSSSKDVGQQVNTVSPDVNTGSLELNVVGPSFSTASSNKEDITEKELILNFCCLLDRKLKQCTFKVLKPKALLKALSDSSWVETMQEELLQFKIQQVWILVDLPNRKKAIGTKWVFRNKKDERGIVIRNKTKLVAQGHRQEEGIDYKEVFAHVARIEAIRLFLAYASFMGFLVYVDDIIFGTTNKELCTGFEKLMKDKFQMSSMGELTFFLGLQVTQRKMVWLFFFATLVDLEKPLVKDGDDDDVDVHLYRSMIGSLMYLTTSRPDIMFACKKQTVVATSTTEAEYVAVASCCGKVLWIQNQLLDYGYNFMNTVINIDNNYTICIIENPVQHSKTKDIEIRHHFIRDCNTKKLIQVAKIHTDLNVADLLTKGFDAGRFQYLVSINMQAENYYAQANVNVVNEDMAPKLQLQLMKLRQLQSLVDKKGLIDSGVMHKEKDLHLDVQKRTGKDFSGRITPLFDTMMVQPVEEIEVPQDEAEHEESNQVLDLQKGKRYAQVRRCCFEEENPRLERMKITRLHVRAIADIDADVEVTLVDETQVRHNDDLIFDTGVLDDVKMPVKAKVDRKDEQSTKTDDSTAGEAVTTASDDSVVPTTNEEITLAHTLIQIKAAKPKVVTTAATTATTTRPKESSEVPQMINLQVLMIKEKEREELIDEEKAKLFMELMEKRRKHFAALRAQEKRNRPPTKAQKRFLKILTNFKLLLNSSVYFLKAIVKTKNKKEEVEKETANGSQISKMLGRKRAGIKNSRKNPQRETKYIPEEDVEPKQIILDLDDQPMWESAKTVAPTPNSAIMQLDVDDNFVINSTHLNMIRENKFDGYLRADPHDHIREFLAICNMFRYGKTQSEAVKLMIFPLSLCDEAKTWFNELNEESIISWE
ncbi:retrovirus-related pol polyprotein from transposon TNT 1-94, partial [Tanacetum coccineum]